MFSDAPELYCNYRVKDPDGAGLPLINFGLQRNYVGNPVGVGVGYLPPHTVDRFGEVADWMDVIEEVERHLVRHPNLTFVDVVQEVIGAVSADEVGVVGSTHRRVRNPHFAKAAQ